MTTWPHTRYGGMRPWSPFLSTGGRAVRLPPGRPCGETPPGALVAATIARLIRAEAACPVERPTAGAALYDAGHLPPLIDKTFAFDQTHEALA
jgi:hypothetical protein